MMCDLSRWLALRKFDYSDLLLSIQIKIKRLCIVVVCLQATEQRPTSTIMTEEKEKGKIACIQILELTHFDIMLQ